MLGTGTVTGTAVANAALVLGDGLNDGRRAGHGLRARRKILTIQDFSLEKLIGAGAVFTTVKGNGQVGAADSLPVFDFAGKDVAELTQRQLFNRAFGINVNRETVHGYFVFRRAGVEGFDTVGNFRRFGCAGGITQICGLVLQGRKADA